MRILALSFLIPALMACTGSQPAKQVMCGLAPDRIGTFADLPAGTLQKGQDAIYAEEINGARVHVEAFSIQIHEVTNDQFSAFVAQTGYVTDAERGLIEGREDAGSAVFSSGRWQLVPGAAWNSPEGPGSDITGRGRDPVVHISLADARAYAAWAGGRLPSEEEWEYAAQLGLPDPARADSGAYDGEGMPVANTWQGLFPVSDMAADGFAGRSPAGCFGADRTGLYDMIGNVWEWTETPFDPYTHTIKGGSYLCAANFCRRYRPAARQSQERDFSTGHIGFRIVRDIP